MIKYYSKKELAKKAEKTLVSLKNQETAREEVLTLVSNFLTYLKGLDNGYKPSELPFYSMFLIGSTGSGKTELIKRIGAICGLQTAIVDASSFTGAGFKGINVANGIKAAIDGAANPHAFTSQGGIIILDECDKLACTNPYYYESNAQANLLKVIEREAPLQVDIKDSNPVTINTDRILFVFTGAFSRLEPVLKRKYQKNSELGFLNADSKKENIDYMSYATIDDLTQAGMLKELLGRIGSLTYIPPLDKDDFVTLINGKGNSMKKIYQNMFHIHGVSFDITDDACALLGKEAQKLGTGARALQPLLRKHLAPAYEAIDERPEITKVVLTTKDDVLTIKYKTSGTRNLPAHELNIDEPRIDQNISHLLKSEGGIHFLCQKLVNLSNLQTTEQHAAFYYFLQTQCRYLVHETNESDHVYSSLIKLSKAMLKDSLDDKSVFDVMLDDIDDWFTKRISYQAISTFYQLYNSLSSPSMTKILIAELECIQDKLSL